MSNRNDTSGPDARDSEVKPDSPRISMKGLDIVMFSIYTLLIVSALLIHFTASTPAPTKSGWFEKLHWDWGWALLFFTLTHIALSLRTVSETEYGALFFFGRPVAEVEPGPVKVYFGLLKLRTDQRGIIQMEIPGEPEEVQKSDQDNIAEGKKAPVRINQAAPRTAVYYTDPDDHEGIKPQSWDSLSPEMQKSLEDDPLQLRLTTEVSGVLRFRIRPGQYIHFLQTTGSLDNAQKSLEDAWVRTAQSELGRVTPSHALTKKNVINRRIKLALEAAVGEHIGEDEVKRPSWGIDIETAEVKLIDLGERVNIAMAEATAAEFKRKAIVSTATAERDSLELVGTGKAAALRSVNQVQVETSERRAKIAESTGGQFALAQETLQLGLQNARHTILSPASDLLGVVAGAAEVVKNLNSPPTPSSTPPAT